MHATIAKIPLPLRSIEYHFFSSDTLTALCVESNPEIIQSRPAVVQQGKFLPSQNDPKK